MSKADYEARFPLYEALRQETVFILQGISDTKHIKIHEIESRTKDFASLQKKMASADSQSIDEINDVVGCRVVCLFKSDLPTIIEFIEENFFVVSTDNKIEESSDSFGYMSIHFVCEMRKEYTGPRYERIGSQKFEIQVRTLCMHAWAAISHYLDYKTEWDIPVQLRKGLNALSGLFYVADAQYEQLYNSRQLSLASTEVSATQKVDSEQLINFDTIRALLISMFPDRLRSNSEKISHFVKEVIHNKFTTISEVRAAIERGLAALPAQELSVIKKQQFSGDIFYADLGAARTALKLSNPDYDYTKFGSL